MGAVAGRCIAFLSDWFAAGFQVPPERICSKEFWDLIMAGLLPAVCRAAWIVPSRVALNLFRDGCHPDYVRVCRGGLSSLCHPRGFKPAFAPTPCRSFHEDDQARNNFEFFWQRLALARVRQRGGKWGATGCAENQNSSRTGSARPFTTNAGSRAK